jgi:predicted oxidoreductase
MQFAMFMVLFAMTNIPGVLNLWSEKLSDNIIKNIQIGILAIFIVFAGSQAFDARYVKGQLAARDAKLKNLKGQDVTLTEVDFVRTPTTRHFEDLASDSSYWLNQCVANYYGLKSIKMVDNRTDKTVMGKSTR